MLDLEAFAAWFGSVNLPILAPVLLALVVIGWRTFWADAVWLWRLLFGGGERR